MRFIGVLALEVLIGVGAQGCGDGKEVTPLSGALSVSVGTTHACAVLMDGRVACWGGNSLGELGHEATYAENKPSTVAGLTGATDVVAGNEFSCALVQGGAVSCWGSNISAELGNGGPFESQPGSEAGKDHDAAPVVVTGLAGPATFVVSGGATKGGIGSSGHFSCAHLRDGTVSCWGRDEFALGAGGLTIPPTQLPGLTDVTTLAFADGFGCALLVDGTVSCWGDGSPGVGGKLAATPSTLVRVPGLANVASIALAADEACAVTPQGTVSCWGGLAPGASQVPVEIPMVQGVVTIAAGGSDVCALLDEGTVWCWGPETRSFAEKPVRVAGVSGAVAISVGGVSACAIVARGELRCWGANDNGQLGDGAPLVSSGTISPAVTVVAPEGAAAQ